MTHAPVGRSSFGLTYTPVIASAHVRKRYTLGAYEAALLDDIRALGRIDYLFLFVVFEAGHLEPCWFVAAERPAGLGLDPELIPESAESEAVLCTFDGDGHNNFGPSTDWRDPDLFEQKALRMFGETWAGDR